LRDLAYIAKVWGVACLVSPIVLIIGFKVFNFKISDFLYILPGTVIVGLIFSAPTFILLACILYNFSYKLSKPIKVVLIFIIGLLGICATFAIVIGRNFFHFGEDWYFPLTYALVFVLSLIVFYPKSAKKEELQQW